MVHHKIKAIYGNNRGTIHRVGNGWPSFSRRWCTRLKTTTIDKYCKKRYGKHYYAYIGFAADEIKRTGCGNACEGESKYGINRLYPLIYHYEMNEKQCLEYCYSLGFDWEGLYDYFHRVSCFCCPLQSIKELEILRKNFPDLWNKMLMWEKDMEKTGASRGFKGYKSLHSFDKRFEIESKQPILFRWN